MRIAVPLIVAACLCAASCQSVGTKDVTLLGNQSGRFSITSAQKFDSGGRERHIVVLFDTKTEKEYLAVMGAGVYDITVTNYGTKPPTSHADEE